MSKKRTVQEIEFIPTLQIRNNCLLIYNQIINPHRKTTSAQTEHTTTNTATTTSKTDQLTGTKTYSGDMTSSSINRLRRVINTLVAIAEPKQAQDWKRGKEFTFKLNFITLTLPAAQGAITDKQIKKEALEPFLRNCKRKLNLKSYVWKAEKQDNGNLHFHLTTDTYIHYEDLRNEWNNALRPLGFIDRFEAKHNHSHPNSTDVHAIHKVKDLTSYLIKYMTKENKDEERILGKMWDCSINLKQKRKCTIVIDTETGNMIDKVVKEHPNNVRIKEFVTFIFLDEQQFKKHITGKFLAEYNEWRTYIRDYERNNTTTNKTGVPDRKPIAKSEALRMPPNGLKERAPF